MRAAGAPAPYQRSSLLIFQSGKDATVCLFKPSMLFSFRGISARKAKHLDPLAFLEHLQQDLPAIRKPHGVAIAIFHGGNLRKGDLLGGADLAFALQALRDVSQQQPGTRRDADRADGFRITRREV